MYAIRYRKLSTGNEFVRILGSWDEAMDAWAHLMSEPAMRVVPDPVTGLEIQPWNQERNVKDMPPAFQLLSAS